MKPTLLALLLVPACQVPDPTTPPASERPATSAAAATSAGATDPSAAPAAAPIVYFVDDALWRVEADGSDRRALGLSLAPDGPNPGGAIGFGDNTPAVSRDGRWVAWADATDLWLAQLDGAAPSPTRITSMPARKDDWIVAADVAFSTWSPDSRALVVSLREPGYEEEDPLPLPPGLQYGFYVLRGEDPKLVPAPQIEGVYAWTPDSQAVLDNKYRSAGEYELRAQPIAGGPAQVLRTLRDPYGFSQLDCAGDACAWMATPERSGQVMVARFGAEPRPMSPLAPFADIQWPRVAPDGAHVLFEWKGRLHVSDGAEPGDSTALPHTQLRWYDATRLIGLTAQGLALIDLDGAVIQVLDPAATSLPRR